MRESDGETAIQGLRGFTGNVLQFERLTEVIKLFLQTVLLIDVQSQILIEDCNVTILKVSNFSL